MSNVVSRRLSLCAALACLAALAGCDQTPSPSFHLNMVEIASKQIPKNQQQEIANILEAMFGTPDHPYVLTDTGLDQAKLDLAAGPVRSDQFGKETGLYRRHCGHCHGTTGDGMGPTAFILNPYPRDYRQGKFKFKSTERASKPTDHDLEIIVRHGVQGTAMPAFDLLPDPQIKALIEYVKYLSIRGQTEINLIIAMTDLGEGESLETSRGILVDQILKPVVESWQQAPESIVQPPEKPDIAPAESIAQGRDLFYGKDVNKDGNCAKCHGWSALGDGQTSDYDDWNKQVKKLRDDMESEAASLATDSSLPPDELKAKQAQLSFDRMVLSHDALPPRAITPRNLRQNIYRGGRRPVDLYRRISAGINGVPMPGVGPASPGATGTLTPEEIWALVDYVRSLPYEPIGEPPRIKPLVVGQAGF